MNINRYVSPANVGTSCLFLIVSWGLLHLWMILIHEVDEKVAATIISSPVIYGCIAATSFFLAIQHKGGGLTELLVMALCLALIFIYPIIIFSILLNIAPDIADLVFYCECFLIIFFVGSPIYLMLRMI
ncbi:transporter [Enterobacter cloacae]|uniref:colistin resistant protein CrrC n=1 Tax=Enterobacter cloacae TaxID=550 RepID=UPI00200FE8A4|nr:transporter [Enterobacter cloacae]